MENPREIPVRILDVQYRLRGHRLHRRRAAFGKSEGPLRVDNEISTQQLNERNMDQRQTPSFGRGGAPKH